jgi:hypothetical protein
MGFLDTTSPLPALPYAMSSSLSSMSGMAHQAVQLLQLTLQSKLDDATTLENKKLFQSILPELRIKAADLVTGFNEELERLIRKEFGLGPCSPPDRYEQQTDWNKLSLVGEDELDRKLLADKIALQITQRCDVMLTELDLYFGDGAAFGLTLLHPIDNPLRAEIIGQSVVAGLEQISTEINLQKLLAKELGQIMTNLIDGTYQQIIEMLKGQGFMAYKRVLKTRLSGSKNNPRSSQAPFTHDSNTQHTVQAHKSDSSARHIDSEFGIYIQGTQFAEAKIVMQEEAYQGRLQSQRRSDSVEKDATRVTVNKKERGLAPSVAISTGYQSVLTTQELTQVLRQLTLNATAHSGLESSSKVAPQDLGSSLLEVASSVDAREELEKTAWIGKNLIRTHRSALLEATAQSVDPLMIDLVGSLFDQILLDSRVPPQLARQIARLQLPVLRVALSDRSFFSSRQHPVRKLINRLASLGCGYDDWDSLAANQLLTQIAKLVQTIIDGDFENTAIYGEQLELLENFVAHHAALAVESQQACATLIEKKQLPYNSINSSPVIYEAH